MKTYIRIYKLLISICFCLLMISCNNIENKSVIESQKGISIDGYAEDNYITSEPESETNELADDQDSNRITDTPTPAPTPVIVPTLPIDEQITPMGSISDSITDSFDLETFKSIVINSVNDDLWYLGDGSFFNGFESKTMDMEIYTRKGRPNIWVVFSYPLRNNDINYICVLFYSDKRGVLNDTDTYDIASTYQEVESMFSKGSILFEKTEITFHEITKPIYPETTAAKDEKVSTILNNVIEAMNFWEFDRGSYKVYIQNFRDNSMCTDALIENGEGKTWIMPNIIYDDGNTEVSCLYDTEDYMMENRVSPIKDTAVRVEDVTIEQE